VSLVTFAIIGIASAPTAQQSPAARPVNLAEHCTPSAGMTAARRQPPRIRKLGEEPPADQFYAVYRMGRDGCPDPIVLRKDVGSNRDRQIDIAPVPHGMSKPR
jgi:hypothetical protein